MTRRALTTVLLLSLSACGARTASTQTAANIDNHVKIDLSSPDRAIKTWWGLRDAFEAISQNACEERSKAFAGSAALKDAKQIVTGPATETTQAPTCPVFTYGRDIIEVKVESETRAVVLANIKALTPLPAGAEPSAEDLRKR